MDPNKPSLLGVKAICLWKIGDLMGSITEHKRVIELEPNSFGSIKNLMELYLLTNQLEEFKELYTKNKRAMLERGDGPICTFFEALENYLTNNAPGLKETVKNYLKELSAEKEKRTG